MKFVELVLEGRPADRLCSFYACPAETADLPRLVWLSGPNDIPSGEGNDAYRRASTCHMTLACTAFGRLQFVLLPKHLLTHFSLLLSLTYVRRREGKKGLMCYGFGLRPLKQKLPPFGILGHMSHWQRQLAPSVSVQYSTYVSFIYMGLG
jgi:hypothetical protein